MNFTKKSNSAFTPNKLFWVALLCYIIAAIYNTGHYHPDEHYQIIEFAGLKAGYTNLYGMAWEYERKIRPALQPLMFFGLHYLCTGLNLNDPFVIMIILRVLTSILTVLTLRKFYNYANSFISSKYSLQLCIITYFTWFFPIIATRFSSETYAMLFAAQAIPLVNSPKSNKYFLSGLLFGISFIFRFQMGLLILGVTAWLIIIQKLQLDKILIFLISIASFIGVSVTIDSLFYGEFTLTFLNYFKVNIINDVASVFGRSPWYYYLNLSLRYLLFPLSVAIVLSFFIYIYSNKKSLTTWAIVPFLIVHSITPHKELRFLFPLAVFIPLIVMNSWENITNRFRLLKVTWVLQMLVMLCFLFNSIAFLITITSPVDNGRNNIINYVYYKLRQANTVIWFVPRSDPFNAVSHLEQGYYKNNLVEKYSLNNIAKNFDHEKSNYLAINNYNLIKYNGILEGYHLTLLKRGSNRWVDDIKFFFGFRSEKYTFCIYKIEVNGEK